MSNLPPPGPPPEGSGPGSQGPPPVPPPSAPPPLPGDPGPAPGPPPLDGDAVRDGAWDPEAEPPPVDPDERAAFQVTEQTRTYPCRQCGAHLTFDISSQQLACDSCGFSADIDVSDLDQPTERDLRSTMSRLHELVGAQDGTLVSDEKEIVCQSCGGHTTFSGTLTATKCPYCAVPIQRDDVHDAPVRLGVDGVLPFQVDEKVAREALEKWINSRWFAPSEFKKYRETGAFTSIYAAYFTYDADTTTDYRGKRGDNYTVTVGSGDNRRTETRTRWRSASGRVRDSFDDIAVLANDGFDRKRVAALEPWPTGQAKPFSPEYVAGHLARTYDRDAEVCFGEAKQVIDRGIERTVRQDIGGDKQQINHLRTVFHSLLFKHLLLPIWLLTVVYEGKPFQVFINGVTGEVQGQRPYSKVKIAAAVVAAVVAAIIVIVIWQSASGSSSG